MKSRARREPAKEQPLGEQDYQGDVTAEAVEALRAKAEKVLSKQSWEVIADHDPGKQA